MRLPSQEKSITTGSKSDLTTRIFQEADIMIYSEGEIVKLTQERIEKLLCNECMVDTLHNDERLYLSKEQRDSQTVRKVNPQSRLLKCIYTDEGG
jgi:hypothetical protein